MKLHDSITTESIVDAIERDRDSGFCIDCGYEVQGVEPDARKYWCESCGELAVYGAEELLIMTEA